MKIATLDSTSPQHPLNLFFYSNPSSPRLSSTLDYLSHDEHHEIASEAFSFVPFNWELMPGIPKSPAESEKFDQFDFSGQLNMMANPSLSSADQLFDGGVIKPLKPPPGLEFRDTTPVVSPKQRSRPSFKIDPFEVALHNSTKSESQHEPQVRGRDPTARIKRGSSRRGISRSLSPLRVSEFALFHQQKQQQAEEQRNNTSNDKTSLSSLFSRGCSSGSSKKWRLKDLFLFRSASEGTTTSSGKKYSFLSRRNSMENDDSNRGSSFRSSTSGGGSVSKRRGQPGNNVSAHEMHYTAKRAVSEELKKKTSLPYRHGLLHCLGFSPILHNISNAFAT